MEENEEFDSDFNTEDVPISEGFWNYLENYWHNNREFPESTESSLNKKADLVDGKVPTSQLPSYVDDVVEFDTFENLPILGEKGKIYVIKNNNTQFRWSGSEYIQLNSDEFFMTTNTDQDVIGVKTYLNNSGNSSLYDNKLQIKGTNGSKAGISFWSGFTSDTNWSIGALGNSFTIGTNNVGKYVASFNSDNSSEISKVKFLPFEGGTWMDMPVSGISGIGHDGVGSNAWIARCAVNGQFFTNSAHGDLVQRNSGAKLMWGNTGSDAGMFMQDDILYLKNNIKIQGHDALHTGNFNPSNYSTTDLTNLTTVHAVNSLEGTEINDFDTISKTQIGSIFIPNDRWWHLINIRHRNGEIDGAGWSTQLRIDMTSGTEDFQYRTQEGSVWKPWRTVWTSKNFEPNNYVKSTTDQLIYDTKTFSNSPKIPNGSAGNHAVNKSQLDKTFRPDIIVTQPNSINTLMGNVIFRSQDAIGHPTGLGHATGIQVAENSGGSAYGWQLLASNEGMVFRYNNADNYESSVYKRIWTDSDFTKEVISQWNEAYKWGNHSTFGYTTQSWVESQDYANHSFVEESLHKLSAEHTNPDYPIVATSKFNTIIITEEYPREYIDFENKLIPGSQIIVINLAPFVIDVRRNDHSIDRILPRETTEYYITSENMLIKKGSYKEASILN